MHTYRNVAPDDLQVFVQAVVAANLFGPIAQIESSFGSAAPLDIKVPNVSQWPVVAAAFQPLTASETRQLIIRCKQLKQEIGSHWDPNHPDAQAKMQQYQTWKRRVRESAAIMIQKHWRGHRVRRPVSQSGRQYQDALALLWAEIEQARQEAGRQLPVENWGIAELKAEKKILKLSLARKHSMLTRKLGRAPLKPEKEVYRPVYAYYHKVKKLLQDQLQAVEEPQKQKTQSLLERLRIEKRELQTKLNNYEKEFYRLKGRKIKYHEDIRPVKEQWNRYKVVKAQLDQMADGGRDDDGGITLTEGTSQSRELYLSHKP